MAQLLHNEEVRAFGGIVSLSFFKKHYHLIIHLFIFIWMMDVGRKGGNSSFYNRSSHSNSGSTERGNG